MRLFRVVILFFSLFKAFFLQAQNPILRHLTDEQGLPCLAVYDLMEDERGFMWLGTDKGLYRYDGVFFKQMPNAGAKPNILTRLRKQQNGRIFGFNFSGEVGVYHNDSVRVFNNYSKIKKAGLPNLAIDGDNNFWISSDRNPLMRYHFKADGTVEEREFYLDKAKFDTTKIEMKGSFHVAYGQGKIWFMDCGILGYVDPKTLTTHSLYELSNEGFNLKLYATQNKVFLVYRKKNNTNKIDEYTPQGLKPSSFWRNMEKQVCTLNEIMEDDDGTIWVATSNGVWHLAADGTILQHLLDNVIVGNVVRDREGQYWFCSPYDGVFCMATPQLRLFNYPHNIMKMAFDGQKNLFLGTNDGKLLTFDVQQQKTLRQFELPTRLDWQGMAWLGGSIQQLAFCRKNTHLRDRNGQQKLDFEKFATDKDYVASMLRNGFFTASSYGALFYDIAKKEARLVNSSAIERYFAVKKRPHTGGGRDEEIWFASGVRLGRLTGDSTWQHIATPMGINDFCFASAHQIWLATPQNGLCLMKIQPDGNLVLEAQYDQSQGLLGNRVGKIRQDTDGSLWLVVEGAVQHFDVRTQQFRNFSRANGLLSQELYDICLTPDHVWLASSKGLQYFPKHKKFTTDVTPLVYIESAIFDGKNVPMEANNFTTASHDNIQFNFTGISLLSNGRFSYRYRLVGVDTTWATTTATSNFARYQSLKSGDYRFEVQLLTEDGRSSDVATYIFTVRLPFWQSTWFYVLLGFIGFVGLTAYFLWMIRKLNERNQFEQRLANATIENSQAAESQRRAQLAALKAQMNPHFIFNALNSIQAFIFLNDKNAANTYLGKFSTLIRRTLDMSQDEAIPLDEEIELLENYLSLEAMRLQNLLSWTIETAPPIDTQVVSLPPLLVQPYVENAIKHGLASKTAKTAADRHVHIYFEQDEDENLICLIRDNGIGRARAQELLKQRNPNHHSFSTSATEQRLELLNNGRKRKIYVSYEDIVNGDERGTLVKIVI